MGNILCTQRVGLFQNPYDGTRIIGKGRTDLQADAALPGQFHATIVQDLGAPSAHGQHFILADVFKFYRIGIFAGIFVVHSIHIGVDDAAVGV